MTNIEYDTSCFKQMSKEGYSVNEIAYYYDTEPHIVSKLLKSEECEPTPAENIENYVPYADKIAKCNEMYGRGTWHFCTGEEITKLLSK